jgi:hypothetical protein
VEWGTKRAQGTSEDHISCYASRRLRATILGSGDAISPGGSLIARSFFGLGREFYVVGVPRSRSSLLRAARSRAGTLIVSLVKLTPCCSNRASTRWPTNVLRSSNGTSNRSSSRCSQEAQPLTGTRLPQGALTIPRSAHYNDLPAHFECSNKTCRCSECHRGPNQGRGKKWTAPEQSPDGRETR